MHDSTTVAEARGTGARKAGRADLPSLSHTLAAAFFEDPVFSWWIDDAEARQQILPDFFKVVAEANLAHDETYTEHHRAGGAVWVPPGADDDGEQLMDALGRVSGRYAETLFGAFELMEEQHPRDPHYYLFFLGTRPEWQRRGIGSALMRPVLGTCDREGVPAYLEATSEDNKRLYLRHGFHVTGELALPDGPSIWPMWRPPR